MKLKPTHPGEILAKEFLQPNKISQYKLAKAINVDPRRISLIVKGKRSISSDTALRLERFFGSSAEFWLNLQMNYDLKAAKLSLAKIIEKEVTPFQLQSA